MLSVLRGFDGSSISLTHKALTAPAQDTHRTESVKYDRWYTVQYKLLHAVFQLEDLPLWYLLSDGG